MTWVWRVVINNHLVLVWFFFNAAELMIRIDEEEGDGAVLIFLPGWDDITKVHQSLNELPHARRWRLFCLHSHVPMDQQR